MAEQKRIPNGAELLGAAKPKDAWVMVYIPSEDRDEKPIDHEYWRIEAVRLMSKLFGGATSVRGVGGWLDRERGGKVKEEENSMVFSFMDEEDWNEENIPVLKDFLYRMGRETRQGAVGIVVMGEYLEIPGKSYE